MGTRPNLIISDLKLARQILVTDFNLFRQTQTFVLPEIFANLVGFVPIHKWKHLRMAMSPAFSSAKLRNSIEHLKQPMKTFVQNLNEWVVQGKEDQLCIKEWTKSYTLDCICKFVFSAEMNSFKQQHDPFVSSLWKLIKFSPTPLLLTLLLPTWMGKLLGGWIAPKKLTSIYNNFTSELIKKRRQNSDLKYNDFLELMLENDTLTDQEISSNCFAFFLGKN